MSDRSFASVKLTALGAIASDASLPKIASRIAILLMTKYMHADTGGWAFPSLSTIARDLALKDESTVRSALKALVRSGHLVAEERDGRTTRYGLSAWKDPLAKTGGVFSNPSEPDGHTPLANPEGTPPVNAHPITLLLPSEKKEVCPEAGKPLRTRPPYPDEFEAWWRGYPTDPLMSKKEAGAQWKRLSPDDRELATKSLSAFRAFCASKPDYRPVHANRYLSQRRFDGFGTFVERSSGKKWIRVGTSQFNAWNTWYQDTYGKSAPRSDKGGWYFPSEWPPNHRDRTPAGAALKGTVEAMGAAQ